MVYSWTQCESGRHSRITLTFVAWSNAGQDQLATWTPIDGLLALGMALVESCIRYGCRGQFKLL